MSRHAFFFTVPIMWLINRSTRIVHSSCCLHIFFPLLLAWLWNDIPKISVPREVGELLLWTFVNFFTFQIVRNRTKMGKRFPGKVPAVFDGSRLISQLSHYCVFMVFFFWCFWWEFFSVLSDYVLCFWFRREIVRAITNFVTLCCHHMSIKSLCKCCRFFFCKQLQANKYYRTAKNFEVFQGFTEKISRIQGFQGFTFKDFKDP